MAFILGGGIGVRCGKVGERPRGRCRVMMSGVVVAGAGTNLGRAAVENLKARKSEVIALVSKKSEKDQFKSQSVRCHVVNEKERDEVLKLISELEPDVIVNCIGLAFDETIEDDHYLGSVNLVDAGANAKVSRLVYVSALGAGDSESAVPFQVMDTMRPMLMDKSRSELYLRESGLDYTIVRCGPLDEEETNTPVVTEATSDCYGGITIDGLADLLCGCVSSEKAKNVTLTAVDTMK
eukprot:CAMPEP_0113962268 /NCGR_PEP_ID=MMETSP0011_2-20120614/5815_1 /TAXON_ID=101924 /ORGANISM="Rhodosorus marinus" /LENGTH=236 /DNA_ID=CAMNT_0000974091 /DNA_START=76 /DNA_END=786 /DNA_ORIENTATION=- /assembly_acc=CAM_ASM_000156